MPRNSISIIVCTRDRAESLQEALRALGQTVVPADMAVEVLVVDNGSCDRTRPVVRQAKLWGRSPRYLYEPRAGTSYARNAGLAESQGEILLWMDDDVHPGSNWIEALGRPIIAGQADAVAGRIKLPEHLERTWLQPWHRVCLAVDGPSHGDFALVSGNMAFARSVLAKVPGFDTDLGGGALGFAEDTLFSHQLRTAGFRFARGAEDSIVEHHCGEHRLTRTALGEVLMRQGRSQAYIDYHWKHFPVVLPTFRGGKSWLGLSAMRVLQRLRGARDSVIGPQEARCLWRWSYHGQLKIESQRPRRYRQFGLAPWAASNDFAAQCGGQQLRAG